MTKNPGLPPSHSFVRHLVRSLALGLCILGLSLTIGIVGYHHIEGLSWVDSYMEAAMIASGMGPSATLHTTAGKLFAGTYALYSGLALIITVGVILGPIIHHVLHRFHAEVQEKNQ